MERATEQWTHRGQAGAHNRDAEFDHGPYVCRGIGPCGMGSGSALGYEGMRENLQLGSDRERLWITTQR